MASVSKLQHVMEIYAKNRLTQEQIQEMLTQIKKKNDAEAVKLAYQLGKYFIDVPNPENANCTVLHYATLKNLESTFTTCIQLGANTNLKNNWDRLPLHYACEYGSFYMVERIVNKEPKQVNAKDSCGRTPLLWCACSDISLIEKANLLIQRGANVHQLNNDGWNVLHLASLMGRLDGVKLFFEQH